MDMTEHDEKLLADFFSQAAEQEITDDGFTERVLSHVADDRSQRLSRLWTAFCLAVGVVLFVLFDGWRVLTQGLIALLQSPLSVGQVLSWGLSLMVVVWLIAIELLRRERLIAF